MKITLYLSHKEGQLKEREAAVGGALKAGFEKHGDTVEVIPTHEYVRPDWGSSLAVVIGVKGHSKKIFEEYRRGGRQTMLVDKSYFGRTEYVRTSVGGFQPPYLHAVNRPHDRWNRISNRFRIEPKPRHEPGNIFIFAGSSQKYCDWHDMGDVSEYAIGACHSINKTIPKDKEGKPLARLLYRPKPSWVAGHPEDVRRVPNTTFSGPDVKLGALLPKCGAVITHGSNAAVEAVISGTPAIVMSSGACAAEIVAEHELANLWTPRFPSDDERLQWLADLAYCQFDMDEISSGLAWEITAPFTHKRTLMELAEMNERDAVIAQYREMHKSHKMFRGNSIKSHVEAIADLIAEHKPATLLDYGSGKGLQYTELNIHERWGGLKPTCYDPGYPPLAEKPEGKFDGVICTDVAEHIPTANVDEFLTEVIGYSRKFAFFCIYNNEASKFLPDGRNAHLTQMPPQWWLDRICAVSGGVRGREYQVRKPLPGGGVQDFKHYVISAGIEIVVTFRGEE